MIARAILIIIAVGMTWTAVAFGGLAVYLAFTAIMSASAAAAMTALVLLIAVAAGATIYLAATRNHSSTPLPAVSAVRAQDALVSSLAQLAKEHPLMAVGCAAALGLTDALSRKAR